MLRLISGRKGVLDELAELVAFHARCNRQYFPQSVRSLIEKWSETLDRARNPDSKENKKNKKSLAEQAFDDIIK